MPHECERVELFRGPPIISLASYMHVIGPRRRILILNCTHILPMVIKCWKLGCRSAFPHSNRDSAGVSSAPLFGLFD